MKRLTRSAAALGLCGALAAPHAALASDRLFEVSITNISASQVFTPILVASHEAGIRVFDLGEPASDELETIAEEGNPGPLAMALESMMEVRDVATADGPLPPGQTLTMTVEAGGRFKHVSVAAMLVPTNDAFFSITDVKGPRGQDTVTAFSPAYDAGSEPNDELCVNIPGPPDVCQGVGVDLDEDGEGFVHIHRGIHGIGGLDAATFDWRNPVAKIEIRRVQE